MKQFWEVFIRIFLFIIDYFIIAGILQFIGTGVAGVDMNADNPFALEYTTRQHLIIGVFDIAAVLTIVYFFLRYDKINLKNLGISININQLLQAFVLGGVFIVLFFLLFNIFGEIRVTEKNPDLLEILQLTVFLFLAALSEELIFRGYLMKMGEKFVGKFWALVISSLVFALFHIFNPNLTVVGVTEIFLAGLALGYTYFKTGNIWFVTVMHFAWNFLQTILGFNVSGQDFYSVFEFSYLKENLITGGKFGFEGSILSPLAELLTLWIISKYNGLKLLGREGKF